MRKIFLTVLFTTCFSLYGQISSTKSDDTYEVLKAPAKPEIDHRNPLSIKMLSSELWRQQNNTPKWDYESGVLLMAIDHACENMATDYVWQARNRDSFYAFQKKYIDSLIDETGNIKGYMIEDYNLENILCGKALLGLYERTKDEKYRKLITALYDQLEKQPRTSEGGFWHENTYPYQMLLDDIYMSAPFYARYAAMFDRYELFDDVAKQIVLLNKHAINAKTGLMYHGWDEKKEQIWANKTTGCSPNFCSRSIGWYLMGIVDVLDYFPLDHPKRYELIDIFKYLSSAVIKFQDKTTGLWYQVTDKGYQPGNYHEASASCMFIYAIAKAMRKGYISKAQLWAVKKGYDGINKYLVQTDTREGIVTLTKNCQDATLGGENNGDGSFSYYINKPVVDNDLKGTAPFIMASMEMELMDR